MVLDPGVSSLYFFFAKASINSHGGGVRYVAFRQAPKVEPTPAEST